MRTPHVRLWVLALLWPQPAVARPRALLRIPHILLHAEKALRSAQLVWLQSEDPPVALDCSAVCNFSSSSRFVMRCQRARPATRCSDAAALVLAPLWDCSEKCSGLLYRDKLFWGGIDFLSKGRRLVFHQALNLSPRNPKSSKRISPFQRAVHGR